MIDSHCHLTAPEFSDDVVAVIERAKAAKVSTLITISDEMADLPKCRALAEAHENIFFSVGSHPHHAKDFDVARDIALLREAVKHPKCRAVGEVGLDYHYINPPSPDISGLRWTSSPKDTQQRVFEAQLVLARELNLPAVVHCRDAVGDVWTIVSHVRPQKLVIHCCTEKWEDVERFVNAGYLLSFTGIITYPKSLEIRRTVEKCPLASMMVETDSPFLAPAPYRGKRCEPAYVLETAKVIAQIKGLTLAEVDEKTTKVAQAFFER